jgi:putative membrane protein
MKHYQLLELSAPIADQGGRDPRIWVYLIWVSLFVNAAGAYPPFVASPSGQFVVVGASLSFALIHSWLRYGYRGCLTFVALCTIISLTMENASIATGFPFGHYHFTHLVPGPRIYLVPLFVIISYIPIAYTAWSIANIVMDRPDVNPNPGFAVAVPLVAAAFIIIWDLGMDPVRATLYKSWIWERGGSYFGVPLSNFVGVYIAFWIVFQAFAIYLVCRSRSVATVDYHSYWLQPPVAYLLLGIPFVSGYVLRTDRQVADAAGTIWSGAGISEEAFMVYLFGMLPVVVMAVFRTTRDWSSNVAVSPAPRSPNELEE